MMIDQSSYFYLFDIHNIELQRINLSLDEIEQEFLVGFIYDSVWDIPVPL
jgi:hypothetical protein